jgi:predicted nucleic acid-binding protein
MILVDTSIWIEVLNRVAGSRVSEEELLATSRPPRAIRASGQNA